MVTVFSLDKLNYPKALQFSLYGHTAEDILSRVGPGILIAAFVWLILRLVDFIALVLEQKANQTEDTRDNQLIVFFRDFLKVMITIIGILWIIKVCFHQPIGNVLTGLSIVGAALALAAKESLENLIASFIIFFDKPFFTGDTVKVNNISGMVEHIGLRSTRIRTAEKTLVTVPNKQMVDTMLDNWSLRTARRAEIRLELAQQTPIASVEQLIAFIDKYLQQLQTITSHEVVLKDISKNGLLVNIEIYSLPIALSEFDNTKQQLLIAVKKEMEKSKIELAENLPG
jgi:MscS family membrane protein